MHVILIPIGSSGDVHPFIGLGLALRERGHQVTLITSAYFEPLAQRHGLELVPLGTREDFEAVLLHPDAWHPRRSFALVAEWGMLRPLRPLYDIIAERYRPGQTVIVAGSLALAARIAQEKLGVPLATVHLQPLVFRSAIRPPVMAGLYLRSWMPHWYLRSIYWAADKFIIDPIIAPDVNTFRAELGLRPLRRLFHHWIHSPQLVLGLFPEWYGAIESDWPPNTRLTGFPLYDEGDVESLSAELEEFLDHEKPPVVFTPGSAMRQGQAFFAAAVQACRLSGLRGLLLTRFKEQIPADLPPHVRHFFYAPFGRLLPRCAAIVHHGGIGTTAQGLAAGIPQLVMPMAHDQPDNVDRLMRLGVGQSVKPSHFHGPKVASALQELLQSSDVRQRCKEIATRFHQVDARGDACRAIEGLA
jgi:UDP:flavonoid glycosyltransferase YjiC (YdhE family)